MQRVIPSTARDDFAELTLYDLHAATMYSYIYRRVGQPQDAEDLLQEVFTSAFKYGNLADLGEQQQRAWLQNVAQRRIIDRYRHNARAVLLPLEQALETQDSSLTPEEHLLLCETHERLHAALRQLPALQQQVVCLRYGNGLRFAEIATMLDKSEGSVRKMVVRILRQLRTIYTRQQGGPV
ncbi:MAG: RNA polymerase sigma factor [Chloroflexota bacterium]|nr:RNA polymerase sigma factor [Chloroflexota bacterium]